jgi:hypothetical protein
MGLDIRIVEKYVQRGMDEFDSNPLAAQLLRRLASEAEDLFFAAAARRLSTPEQSNAHRALALLLLRQHTLCDRLASPMEGSHESSVRLFHRLLTVDRSFDVKFAKRLPGRAYGDRVDTFDSLRSARALDILEETSPGRRLLPILGHLPDSTDAKIAAKGTLFVGRRVQNPEWARKQLHRGDPRIRANAIEALWGVNTPPATRLLEDCTCDRHSRVVGNALVGLHIVGREDVREEIAALSRHSRAELRSTAAWAMGKIAIPDFAENLQDLVRDEDSGVRGAALQALISLRRSEPVVRAEEETAVVEPDPEVIVQPATPPAQYLSIPSWAERSVR